MKYELIKQHKNAPLMILIHGFGANRYDLLGLGKFFPDVNIISLEAPYNFNSQQSYWYDIQWIGNEKIINTDQAIQSKNLLVNFIENEIEIIDSNFKKDNIFLLGFSQGAILSYAITSELKYIKRVYGLSGYIDETITTINGLNNKNLEIFACHGMADEVIPISKAREANKILIDSELGRYCYIEHNEGHWISQDILTEIIKWHNKND
jgi:phospholipase/carboxylesterase